ncbi:hypothetical protein WMY93_030023 [Mugilogobius chulae]|uniref:Ig-like domain-containing protein n=1 Tax=Mugilogobius chulae TaxID=88201 RepID=A0AAW0MXG9_9GOBI
MDPVCSGDSCSNVPCVPSDGPKNTSAVVSPSGSLSAGQSMTLSCSSRAKPPVQHFTWFRHSSQGPVKVTEGQTYTFNICEEGKYYCEASNQLGNGTSSDIRLQTTVWVSSEHLSYPTNPNLAGDLEMGFRGLHGSCLMQIKDAPGIPSITVSGDQTETEVVTITCSLSLPVHLPLLNSHGPPPRHCQHHREQLRRDIYH